MERKKKLYKEIEELRWLLHDRLSVPDDADERWARYLLEYSLDRRRWMLERIE